MIKTRCGQRHVRNESSAIKNKIKIKEEEEEEEEEKKPDEVVEFPLFM